MKISKENTNIQSSKIPSHSSKSLRTWISLCGKVFEIKSEESTTILGTGKQMYLNYEKLQIWGISLKFA